MRYLHQKHQALIRSSRVELSPSWAEDVLPVEARPEEIPDLILERKFEKAFVGKFGKFIPLTEMRPSQINPFQTSLGDVANSGWRSVVNDPYSPGYAEVQSENARMAEQNRAMRQEVESLREQANRLRNQQLNARNLGGLSDMRPGGLYPVSDMQQMASSPIWQEPPRRDDPPPATLERLRAERIAQEATFRDQMISGNLDEALRTWFRNQDLNA